MNSKALFAGGAALLSLTILLSGCSSTSAPDKTTTTRSSERSNPVKPAGYENLNTAATQWTQAISKKDWKTACRYITSRALVDTIDQYGDCATKGLPGWLKSIGATPDLYNSKYADWSISESNINEDLDRRSQSVQLSIGKDSKASTWVVYKNGWSKSSIMPELNYTHNVGWQIVGLSSPSSKK